jgi:membrane protein implicated in regulation of membrane protease activity
MGFRFYLWVAGVALAIGIGFGLVMLLFTRALYAGGFLAAFAVLAVVALAFGWIFDRREARARDDY